MGDKNLEETISTPGRSSSRRTAIIVVAVVVALAAVGLGTWFALSRPAEPGRADVVRLDKHRVIVDNSMNLYDPLVQQFSGRYSNAISEKAGQPEEEKVLNQDRERLVRESQVNRDRLQQMAESPALQDQEVAESFKRFKDQYGAVIAYNDQLVVNTTNIYRSVGGPCAALHSSLNVAGESYAQDYVKSADECLAALGTAKDGADAETTTLLTAVEAVIRGQRDKQQEVLDSKDTFERLSKSTIAGLALLEINDAFAKAQTTYETATKDKYSKIIESANSSNSEFEGVLKKSLEQFDAASGEGK
ncbi:UNVERIFIED_CONTAM: flagellar basal body-associated protein FliL [Jeotgalibacillus campisalis]